MATGNAALIELIRDRIRARGPISFAEFMELALYEPEYGYYSSGRAAIGRRGDYFTNVSVGPVFGRLIAMQFAEMWSELGAPAEFTIVEQGAHDGRFAHDVLTAIDREHPALRAVVRYWIIEPFRMLQARQQNALAAFGDRVHWCESLDELEPFCGVHFSNELLDSLPVHLLHWNGASWLERCVAIGANDEFEFADQSIDDESLRNAAAGLPRTANAGYITEVNLAAAKWIDTIGAKLTRGFIVIVDYGFARDDYYAPHRTTGTLQSYAAHRVLPSPLQQVGEADITAHVEWSSVAMRAEAIGLSVIGFTDQHHFIAGLLSNDRGAALIETADAKTQRALQTLLHPGFLGMKFQYLVLEKGVGAGPQLSGLRFARDARAALGI